MVLLVCGRRTDSAPLPPREPKPVLIPGESPFRHLVNLSDRNIPTTWNIDPVKTHNIKWLTELGTKAYGGPVFSGGRIFIGTNNGNPRAPQIQGDKGVVMCFEEKTGNFLWQIVHNKLPQGR